MSSFNGQSLFASGPHRFFIGGLELRSTLLQPANSNGAQLVAQGTHARRIVQQGQLLADNTDYMRLLVSRIENAIDGQPYTLIDDMDRTWLNTAMIQFEPEPMRRAGTRWVAPYRITYLQVMP